MSDVLNPATDYATGAADPQDDDLHPNLAGYAIMGQTWYPFVKALYMSPDVGSESFPPVKYGALDIDIERLLQPVLTHGLDELVERLAFK
jgi:hypothetical protein